MFSKEELDKKLAHLAETPPPENLSLGAMCYSVAYQENHFHEYNCPVCWQKTIYRRETDGKRFQYIDAMLSHNLYNCRSEISKIEGIDVKLDEIEFCEHCSPGIQRPQLYLIITIKGMPRSIKTSSFNSFDLQIINEFLNGQLIHKDKFNNETPLANYLDRIKELLGLS